MLLGVILDQFSQRGELLPSVQVIIVPRVLDFNMGDLIDPPAQNKQMGHNRENAGREDMRDDRQDGKDGKDIIVKRLALKTDMLNADVNILQWYSYLADINEVLTK